VFPVLWMISTAFKPDSEIISFTPTWFSTDPTLQHFRDAIARPFFWDAVKNSLIVVGAVVALSMVVMLRVTTNADPLAREDLAFALSVLLLGLLMMVTRRNAVGQVIGFMSLENGLILAATGAKGMPLVVEISVAFSVLIAFIVVGIFLFRIRERFDTVDIQALDRFRGERQ